MHRHHVGILDGSHHLTLCHVVAFLHEHALHDAAHERSHVAHVLCTQNELSVHRDSSVEFALLHLAHAQVDGVDLLLCERYVVEVDFFVMVVTVVVVVGLGVACAGEECKAGKGDESDRHNE